MNHLEEQHFYKLLRLSLGLTLKFLLRWMPTDGYDCIRQPYASRSSVSVINYNGVCLLPEGSKPPVEIAMQWACEAKSIRGVNELLYQEAARLTREFEEKGHRTALLSPKTCARGAGIRNSKRFSTITNEMNK